MQQPAGDSHPHRKCAASLLSIVRAAVAPVRAQPTWTVRAGQRVGISPDGRFGPIVSDSYDSRRARATGWPLALAGTAAGMAGEPASGRERLVLPQRRR